MPSLFLDDRSREIAIELGNTRLVSKDNEVILFDRVYVQYLIVRGGQIDNHLLLLGDSNLVAYFIDE
jgi:hypothetical protein